MIKGFENFKKETNENSISSKNDTKRHITITYIIILKLIIIYQIGLSYYYSLTLKEGNLYLFCFFVIGTLIGSLIVPLKNVKLQFEKMCYSYLTYSILNYLITGKMLEFILGLMGVLALYLAAKNQKKIV